MNSSVLLSILISLGLLCSQAHGARYYVDDDATGTANGLSWINAFPDLQMALDTAIAGDEIWVAAGIYKPTTCNPCDSTDRMVSFELVDGVRMYGGFAGTEPSLSARATDSLSLFVNHATILSGDIGMQGDKTDNSYTVVFANQIAANNTKFDGFIIEKGHASEKAFLYQYQWFIFGFPMSDSRLDSLRRASGGGMFIFNSPNFGWNANITSNALISNCIFRQNTSYIGGGLLILGSTVPTFQCLFYENEADTVGGAATIFVGSMVAKNCHFQSNEAEFGGAIFQTDIPNSGTLRHLFLPNFDNCHFTNNIAQKQGGAVYDGSKSNRHFQCHFESNFAEDGGGIAGFDNPRDSTELTLISCSFQNNIAENAGGGIYANNIFARIEGTTFFQNQASEGGGIWNVLSEVSLSNSLLQANVAQQRGGGIHSFGGEIIIRTDTFLENQSLEEGGALYNSSNQSKVANSIFLNNEATILPGDTFTVANSGGGIYNANNSQSEVDSCIFRNNFAVYGGGAIFNSGSTLHMDSCLIEDNSADIRGGAIYNINSLPTFTRCVISENIAPEGGGMYDLGGNVSLSGSQVLNNRAAVRGGGIFLDSLSQASIFQCTFFHNRGQVIGGGLYSYYANLEMREDTFQENTALDVGGGLSIHTSNLTMEKCKFDQNSAIFGGGIDLKGSSDLGFHNCLFSQNHASLQGGALRIDNSTPLFNQCLFSENTADEDGGAIHSLGQSAPRFQACTFADNTAKKNGGALNHIDSSYSQCSNTTFSSNMSLAGGGVYLTAESGLSLQACTMTRNRADSVGGAIFLASSLASCDLENTLIAQNLASRTLSDNIGSDSTSPSSLGHNLVSDTTGSKFLPSSSDQLGNRTQPVFALLGEIGYFGGPVPVHPLLPYSPALSKGQPLKLTNMTVDQRGYSRTIGSRSDSIDIGAFEAQHTFVTPINPQVCKSGALVRFSQEIVIADSTGGAWQEDPSLQTLVLTVPNDIILLPDSIRVSQEGTGIEQFFYLTNPHQITLIYERQYTTEPNFIRISGLSFEANNAGDFQMIRTGGTAIQWENAVEDSVPHAIFTAFPSIAPLALPYQEPFNQPNRWFTDQLLDQPLWQWGQPSGSIINQALTGSQAWMTDTLNAYLPDEDAWLSSPCFDLSSLKKPMISLNYWSDTEEDFDGAVLQATFDGGKTWEVIGTDTSGLNWYNSKALIANPGNQQTFERYGWTGRNSSWLRAAHSLDESPISASPIVRFRIAFKSNDIVLPTASNNGFALDDVYIGERTRSVLQEHFTSTGQTDQNDHLNQLADQFPKDVIPIQYHLQERDTYFQANPGEIISRAVFYGISSPDRAVLGGNDFSSFADSLNEKGIDTSRLDLASFAIHIDPSRNSPFSVVAKQNVFSKTQVQIAVVENIWESGKYYQHVLRKFLPDAGGILVDSWDAGEERTLDLSWTNDQYPKPVIAETYDSLHVIIWIQDLETKEIYQVAVHPVWPDLVDPADVGRSAEPLMLQDQFLLYPNPVQDLLFLQLDREPSAKTFIRLLDMQGRLVQQLPFGNASRLTSIKMGQFTGGVYQLLLGEGEEIWYRKRVVVK